MDKQLENELNDLIDKELERCTSEVYPTLCKMKESEVGLARIRKMVKAVLIENPMSIGSALAQVDSSY